MMLIVNTEILASEQKNYVINNPQVAELLTYLKTGAL